MTQEFDYSIVKNPQIFRINRLDAHSDHEYIMPSENTGEGSAFLGEELCFRGARLRVFRL